ncbi:methyltransferase [Rhizodiscina lignyota]|uniref:tRNA N(3)-methylcytidine methyltransferase n=1 Tax=Rhizodiscina lignyota TaxID=1504668 RepID=A0A9P4IHN4_9PEZI|nr:methyltransferase [Rhizodiscina lignyota]
MEHVRYAVTADPIYHKPTSPSPPTPSETDDYGIPTSLEPQRRPPTRPRDPANTEKRTDPFAFGSRYLEEGDNIFEFNAWDNVETDDSYRDFAESQFVKQREAPVSDFDRRRFNLHPERFWNTFYSHNTANFFKNRKWLAQEFPILNQITEEDAPACTLLEVGAGAGNTAFPILAQNKNAGLRIHACDFSKKAVELIRKNEAYDEKYISADVWDTPGPSLPPGVQPGSVDIVLMIFIFSALSPAQWQQALKNIHRVLKPGGLVLFRDYGRGDLAQVRFKKGRWMEENFYVRGDGTRVYFFEEDELRDIWVGGQDAEDAPKPTFELVRIGTDRRLLVNRQRKLKMYRCWIQACFRKPGQSLFPDAVKSAVPDISSLSISEET